MKKILAFSLLLAFTLMSAAAEDITLSAERMSGSAKKKGGVTVLEGKAVVTVGSLTITGDRIELSGEDYRYVKAVGKVTGDDPKKGFSFSAAEMTYDRQREFAAFRGDAALKDTKHDVDASAGTILYDQKTEVAYLQAAVKLTRKEIDCAAGFALYRRTLSLLDLTGSPVVKRSSDTFRADRISVDLETEHIALDGTVSGELKDAEKPKATDAPAPEGTAEPGAVPATTDTAALPATGTPPAAAPALTEGAAATTGTEKGVNR
jgi:lipopolysaccharide export system protein LptA